MNMTRKFAVAGASNLSLIGLGAGTAVAQGGESPRHCPGPGSRGGHTRQGSTLGSDTKCTYNDAGNGLPITMPTGSIFTDPLGHSYQVSNDCSLTDLRISLLPLPADHLTPDLQPRGKVPLFPHDRTVESSPWPAGWST